MLCGIEVVMVHAVHECGIGTVGWGAHDDQRCAAFEVQGSLWAIGEEASGFDDDIYAKVAPWQLVWVAHLQHLEGLAVDADAVFHRFDRAVHTPGD